MKPMISLTVQQNMVAGSIVVGQIWQHQDQRKSRELYLYWNIF